MNSYSSRELASDRWRVVSCARWRPELRTRSSSSARCLVQHTPLGRTCCYELVCFRSSAHVRRNTLSMKKTNNYFMWYIHSDRDRYRKRKATQTEINTNYMGTLASVWIRLHNTSHQSWLRVRIGIGHCEHTLRMPTFFSLLIFMFHKCVTHIFRLSLQARMFVCDTHLQTITKTVRLATKLLFNSRFS